VSPIALACAACGARPSPREPYPFRCPNAGRGDDLDHLIARRLDPAGVSFPRGGEANPFVRYRTLSHAWQLATSEGLGDASFVGLVEDLDRAIARVAGHGFVLTPWTRQAGLDRALGLEGEGGVWAKDETGNVAGSHKARHLAGLVLHLEVAERVGLTTRAASDRRGLAIASCGNAALAAAVVARAARRPLRVFIPPDAGGVVVERLHSLGAAIETCTRNAEIPGDPCHHAFRRAVERGALPFGCQGPDNGLTIEGGETLAWELVDQLPARGETLDRLMIQVGGGALASACVQGLREAKALGAIARLPRIHPVQTTGALPLRRAYERLRERILAALAAAPVGAPPASPRGEQHAADLMRQAFQSPAVRDALRYAQTHRSEFMWPWETAPKSVARGILDDETYDWFAVIAGTIESGGWPVTASEAELSAAPGLTREATGIEVDATGAAGLAGLLELRRAGALGAGERAGVLLTGVAR